jgi:hypothetical protein
MITVVRSGTYCDVFLICLPVELFACDFALVKPFLVDDSQLPNSNVPEKNDAIGGLLQARIGISGL